MTEAPSIADLKQARVVAAMRSLTVLLMEMESGKDDRLLRIVNLKADLTDEERGELLSVILSTFPADQAEALVLECFKGAGIPVSGLQSKDAMADARFWAQDASPTELKAYAAACANAMSKEGQKALHEWLGKKLGGEK